MKQLIIIGCGPKAIALAAKAHVLRKLGWEVPELTVIDKSGPAANWDGTNGYTDGELILGTSPLEDMGFPYSSLIDQSVDGEMQKYSWFAYIVSLGNYAEWVNRNQRPTHGMLANYFKWVVKKIGITVIKGEVTNIKRRKDKWAVIYKHGSLEEVAEGEGLVITGPGDPFEFPITHDDKSVKEKRIFNGQDIWKKMDLFKDIQNAKIAVIGGGETAAAVVTGLIRTVDSSSKIEIITKHPMLFTRNENWMEVMYFSKAWKWAELSLNDRIEIIKHADRGTFSPGTKDLIDGAFNVNLQIGQAKQIEIVNNEVNLVLLVNDKEQKVKYDYIIQATGFNPLSFLKLFESTSFLPDKKSIREKIDYDLSITGLSPKLHLPGLAALSQGPGFPNLSCLGLLSERILTSYIDHK